MGFELIPIPFVRKAGLCIRRFKMNVRFCRCGRVTVKARAGEPGTVGVAASDATWLAGGTSGTW